MDDSRIIGLVSGKGGVGKTSLCVNLGVAISDLGYEVTLVDADFSASNLGVYLGRYEHPVKIQDVLGGGAEIDSAIFRHPSGVKAITSSNELADVEPETEDISQILEAASKDSDFVLVDFPPGLDSTVSSIMEGCDELIIVTMPTQTAGINAAQITEKAKLERYSMLGSVINKVEDRPDRELIDREIETMTETHILAEIPYDPEMKEALFHHKPLIDYKPLSKASIEIKSLAANITGEKYSKPKFAKFKRKLNNLKDRMN